jgi:hypothetical protein
LTLNILVLIIISIAYCALVCPNGLVTPEIYASADWLVPQSKLNPFQAEFN